MSERRLVFLICLWALFSCASGFGWIQPSSFRRESPISKDSSIPRSSISSWLEVRLSRLFGACQPVDWRGRLSQQVLAPKAEDPLDARTKTNVKPEDLFKDSLLVDDIPPYVLEYAPLVHLYSKEKFWPCDMAEHLFHITPNLNYTPIQSQSRILNLSNLDKLNIWDGGRFVYLTSNDNVEERPEWLGGQKNIPGIPKKQFIPEKGQDNIGNEDSSTHLSNDDENTASSDVNFQFSSQPSSERVTRPKRQKGTPERADARYLSRNQDAKKRRGRSRAHVAQKDMKRQEGGRSDAPAVLIVVDKGNGVVDAFWFFFYSYNLGNLVFNIRFGNHVGDWEHTMVRFQHGKPKYVYYSEHNFGSAYSYGAVEKIGKRPVAYSAVGTHAMYATPGFQPYVLPFGLLHDQTDRGPLWDPVLNSHTYTYNPLSDDLRASNFTPQAPIEWFYFAGRWGDKFYPSDDKRQYELVGQHHYVSGPFGPRFKNLGRRKVCQGRFSDPCVIKNWLAPTAKYWDGMGDGEEVSENYEDMKF